MRIEHRSDGDVLIVEVLESRLATNGARDLGEQLEHFVALGHRWLVLNLQRVRYIDSSGLGVIVMIRRKLPEGGEVAIVSDQEAVTGVLELTRMNLIFRVFAEEASAVAALHERAGDRVGWGDSRGISRN